MGSRGRRWVTGALERTHSTHSDTNSNATISNGNNNSNGNCGSGSGNVFHVEVFAARKEAAACATVRLFVHNETAGRCEECIQFEVSAA